MAESLRAGHAAFWLTGHKLNGGWTLQRMRDGPRPLASPGRGSLA